jgi:hypothetical protein
MSRRRSPKKNYELALQPSQVTSEALGDKSSLRDEIRRGECSVMLPLSIVPPGMAVGQLHAREMMKCTFTKRPYSQPTPHTYWQFLCGSAFSGTSHRAAILAGMEEAEPVTCFFFFFSLQVVYEGEHPISGPRSEHSGRICHALDLSAGRSTISSETILSCPHMASKIGGSRVQWA